jgi:ACS family hexuronate transporter-like MFS transporter
MGPGRSWVGRFEEGSSLPGFDDRAGRDQDGGETSTVADGRAWGVCWLMFAATVLTYMDRQTVSLLDAPIKAEYGITSNADFGWILSAFYVTYALFQVIAGYVVDRSDLRTTYALAVAWWSLAAAATAIAPSFCALIACRALLGVGESFNWPVALRVTSRVLPPSDRSLGNGIFNSGAAIGAVITPAAVTYLARSFGWQSSFAVIGSAGFIWVGVWLWLVRGELRRSLAAPVRKEPDADPIGVGRPRGGLPVGISAAFAGTLLAAAAVAMTGIEYGFPAVQMGIAVAIVGPLLIAVVVPRERLGGSGWAAGLGDVVRHRRFWILVVVSVTINIGWHFLANWIPSYLKQEWGLHFAAGNLLSTIPFLAADVGNLVGGWWSRRLAAGNRTPGRARLLVMAGAMPMILVGVGIEFAANLAIALVCLSVITAGVAAYMANYFTFTQEVAPRHTGVVVGYLGAMGNLAAAVFQPITGAVKDHTGSYALVFAIIGLAPIIGLAALSWSWGVDRPSAVEAESEAG